jgi:Family of unknown function (DUF6504)
MRRYDDPVDVRKGRVPDAGGDPVEGPEQFVWKDRLWTVHAVLAQWVETGPWWRSRGVHAVLGVDGDVDADLAAGPAASGSGSGTATVTRAPADLAAEREVWRVEASRGRSSGLGVFDLVFDWADGSWRLLRSLD